MSLDEIKEKKMNGDFLIVSGMVGITNHNAMVAFKRVGSKHHDQVVEALTLIIKTREMVLEYAD